MPLVMLQISSMWFRSRHHGDLNINVLFVNPNYINSVSCCAVVDEKNFSFEGRFLLNL